MYHVPNCQLDNFATQGAGNIPHFQDLGGYVARRGVVSDGTADPVSQVVIQHASRRKHNEQHHPHIALPLLTDHNALLNGIEPLNLAIDFSGANTHATGIEHRIRASMNNETA